MFVYSISYYIEYVKGFLIFFSKKFFRPCFFAQKLFLHRSCTEVKCAIFEYLFKIFCIKVLYIRDFMYKRGIFINFAHYTEVRGNTNPDFFTFLLHPTTIQTATDFLSSAYGENAESVSFSTAQERGTFQTPSSHTSAFRNCRTYPTLRA